jgi:CheY-like chemotaxis protein
MSAKNTKHLLFLDDDPDFLDTVEAMIPNLTRQQWRVFLARDAARALALLRKHPIDLVVSDLDMPVVDGLQFLQVLHQVCPHPRKVVLSSHSDEHYRQECLNRGAVLFLKKPASAEGFNSIFRILNEILHWETPQGFSGLLRSVTLSDLVQLECISCASSVLQITTSTVSGRIYIESGRVVHAELEDKQGSEAFIDLVGLEKGGFVVQDYYEPTHRSIEESCDSLLLAAAQRIDEQAALARVDESRSNDLSVSEILQKSGDRSQGPKRGDRVAQATPCYSSAC